MKNDILVALYSEDSYALNWMSLLVVFRTSGVTALLANCTPCLVWSISWTNHRSSAAFWKMTK